MLIFDKEFDQIFIEKTFVEKQILFCKTILKPHSISVMQRLYVQFQKLMDLEAFSDFEEFMSGQNSWILTIYMLRKSLDFLKKHIFPPL